MKKLSNIQLTNSPHTNTKVFLLLKQYVCAVRIGLSVLVLEPRMQLSSSAGIEARQTDTPGPVQVSPVINPGNSMGHQPNDFGPGHKQHQG